MKRKKSGRNKRKSHIIFILFFIVMAVFFYVEEFEKEKLPGGFFDIFKPGKKPDMTAPQFPLTQPRKALPRVAIVFDDLGPNKEMAQEVLRLKVPVTLSILPQQDYSKWIAEEGDRLGHDIMIHLPMEATRPLKLGKGGLYTWMTDEEIAQTVEEDIRSVPHVKGANNHMGSAFTQDQRAMNTVITEIRKHGFFFLDSLTSPKSVGFRLAKAQGLESFRRDIFLDNSSDPAEIESQWEKLVSTARKRGHAIMLAHPRKNTLAFLERVLHNNKDVKVVRLSELTD